MPVFLRFSLLLGPATLLAGCMGFGLGAAPGPAVLPPSLLAERQEQGCDAEDLAGLTGRHFTELAEIRLRGQLRVLWPQQDVTRDLMPDRLNVQVNGAGQIQRMFCG